MTHTPPDEHPRRAQILQAAAGVFAAKGFVDASMNEIVRASGLSKGGVYWHFESKDEILAALFDQFFSAQVVAMEALLAGPEPAPARLLALALSSADAVTSLAQQFPAAHEMYALAQRHPTLNALLTTYLSAYHEQITALVAEGIARDAFRAVDPAETAATLISLFEGVLLVWSIDPDAVDLHRRLTFALNLLLEGLAPTPLEKPA